MYKQAIFTQVPAKSSVHSCAVLGRYGCKLKENIKERTPHCDSFSLRNQFRMML